MIHRFARFTLAVSEISRCWHKLAGEELAKYGLKGPHAIYLTAMYRYPEGITVPQLCELCGKDCRNLEIHQVKKLKDLKGNSEWEIIMRKRRRKTLVVCPECHKQIHSD